MRCATGYSGRVNKTCTWKEDTNTWDCLTKKTPKLATEENITLGVNILFWIILHSFLPVMWRFVWEGWTYWAEDFLPVHLILYIYIILYNSSRSIASSCRRMPVWPNPCFLVASWSNLVGFLTWVQYHACAPRAVVFSCFLGVAQRMVPCPALTSFQRARYDVSDCISVT